ncbi:poly-beta-hydroxybutyrate polymerase family protein, partial [Vibrio parahaemolyticus V-223/04]
KGISVSQTKRGKMKPCIVSSNNPTFYSVRPILIP